MKKIFVDQCRVVSSDRGEFTSLWVCSEGRFGALKIDGKLELERGFYDVDGILTAGERTYKDEAGVAQVAPTWRLELAPGLEVVTFARSKGLSASQIRVV